jgi:hypothetical protein
MREFVRLDLDPVLSEIAQGILEDEARHLGFNHLYLEDWFADAFKQDAANGDDSAKKMGLRLEDVLGTVPPMLDALSAELAEIGIDHDQVYHLVASECTERLEKSVRRGSDVGLGVRAEPRGATTLRG